MKLSFYIPYKMLIDFQFFLSHIFKQILHRKRVKPKIYTAVVISALNLNFYIPYLQHFDRFLIVSSSPS